MTGHRPFNELRKEFSTERRSKNIESTQATLTEMALHELRHAREMSQGELARELHVGQPAVAKLERRADMYVSNLRRFIEALGGTLEITAKFPDSTVAITNFSDIGATPKPRALATDQSGSL